MKGLATTILVVALGLAALFGIAWLAFNLRTTYAPGYSYSKFRSIKRGMTFDEVIAALGKPYRTSTQYWSETWRYFPQTNNANKQTRLEYQLFLPDTYTCFWFSPSGTVVRVEGNYLSGEFLGQTKTDVLGKFNRPSESNRTEYVVVFHYSGSATSSDYLYRNIHFGSSDKVTGKGRGFYFD